MAYVLQQFGQPLLWGLQSTENDGCVLSSFDVSYTAADAEHKNELGQTVGYTSYDMTITFNFAADLRLGASPAAGSTLALAVGGLGSIPGLGTGNAPTLGDLGNAYAGAGASPAGDAATVASFADWKAYVRSMSSSGSRDAGRTVTGSGNFWPF